MKGAAYEVLCVELLSALGFALRRRGGASDGGVDFVGRFLASPQSQGYAVVGQCKAEAKPCGPVYVRELEGAMSRSLSANEQCVLLLLSATGFTTGCIRHALASPRHLALLHLTTDGVLAAALPSRNLLALDAVLCERLTRTVGSSLSRGRAIEAAASDVQLR